MSAAWSILFVMTAPTRSAATDSSDHVALRIWLPGLVALAAIWGCSFVFIEVGIRELHPTYVTLGREAEKVEGAWGVRNLLHLPGEPAAEELATAAATS